MAKKIYYRQCNFKRTNGTVISRTTSIIPEQYAVVGQHVNLKDGDTWETWLVESVHPERIEDVEAQKLSRDYKHHRGHSDI